MLQYVDILRKEPEFTIFDLEPALPDIYAYIQMMKENPEQARRNPRLPYRETAWCYPIIVKIMPRSILDIIKKAKTEEEREKLFERYKLETKEKNVYCIVWTNEYVSNVVNILYKVTFITKEDGPRDITDPYHDHINTFMSSFDGGKVYMYDDDQGSRTGVIGLTSSVNSVRKGDEINFVPLTPEVAGCLNHATRPAIGAMYMLSQIHNVTTTSEAILKGNRAERRRLQRLGTTNDDAYHVLAVKLGSGKKQRVMKLDSYASGAERNLHSVRASYHTYTGDNKLFGRLANVTVFVPHHMRGSKSKGEVKKTYEGRV